MKRVVGNEKVRVVRTRLSPAGDISMSNFSDGSWSLSYAGRTVMYRSAEQLEQMIQGDEFRTRLRETGHW